MKFRQNIVAFYRSANPKSFCRQLYFSTTRWNFNPVIP